MINYGDEASLYKQIAFNKKDRIISVLKESIFSLKASNNAARFNHWV